MFIISKKNFRIRRADGSPFIIPRDYIGEIPQDVAAHWLVKAALADGSIAAPRGRNDPALWQADAGAAARAADADIRPDAGAGERAGGETVNDSSDGDPACMEQKAGGIPASAGPEAGKKETKTKK